MNLTGLSCIVLGMETVLDRIIAEFGTQTALAEALGLRQQSVAEWFANKRIPPTRCADIERLTEGRITRAEIRPDLFGPVIDSNSPRGVWTEA